MSNTIIKIETGKEKLVHHDHLVLFSEFLKLDVANGDCSPRTVRTYYSQVKQFLAWVKDQCLSVSTITQHDVKNYRAFLVDRQYKRATIANKLSICRRFFDCLVNYGAIATNPAKEIKAPKNKTEKTATVKWLSATDIQDLLKAPDTTTTKGKRDKAIIALQCLHGLRAFEVISLQLHHIDFEKRVLLVNGKGGKIREINLIDHSIDILKTWLDERSHVAQIDNNSLFVSLHHWQRFQGGSLSVRGIRVIVDGYLKGLGLKKEKVSCHSLRHSFATLARFAGAKLDAISKQLGHSSITTTQIYADIVDKQKENPAKFLINMLII